MAAPFDINAYLRQLPPVIHQPPTEQEDTCPICLVRYGQENPDTFFIEHPCRLPCGHIHGRVCLAVWLRPQPEGANRSNCPTCRRPLFPAWPEVHDDRLQAQPEEGLDDRLQAQLEEMVEDNRSLIITASRLSRILNDTMPREILATAGPWMRGMEYEISRYLGLVEGGPFTPLPDLQTYIPPARLEEICRSMDSHLVDPRPIAGAWSQEEAEWEAGFAEYQRSMEDPYTINMRRPGHPEWNFHIHVAQLGGYLFTERRNQPSADQWHYENRALNRQLVARKERALYTRLIDMGVDLPAIDTPRGEPLGPNHEAYVNWLTDRNAFRGMAFNEAYRLKRVPPGQDLLHVRSNREIYDMLRDCGVYWEMENDRTGRWRTRDRNLFDDAEERLSVSFQYLILENAFADPTLQRLFPDQDNYQLYRRTIEMRANWDSRRRRWYQRFMQTGEVVVVG